MSEVKTNEPVKQEGEFKIKKKTPKKLTKTSDEPVKVNIKEPLIKLEPEIKRVVIPKEQEEVAQIEEVKETTVEKPIIDVVEDVKEFTPIKEVEAAKVEAEIKEALRDEKVLGKQLPENIEKLVSFMEDTGGTIEDYTRLNADYSSINETVLLKEYYKKNKPYLDESDVELLLEDFSYDEELDEDIDIRKKKLAFKEEVAKAKGFLEETKVKYYDEIKLRSNVNPDTQKATDFFNRYNKQQETAKQQHEQFQESTKQLFNDNFEGFDIKVGDKNYKYNIQNRDKVAENQSNIKNLVGKFLDAEGNVTDAKCYHKAMYAADNVDKIAAHFYEQGKADAVKEVVSNSKNLSSTKARSTQGEVFINGLKVKAISGADSTKLKIKTKKFN